MVTSWCLDYRKCSGVIAGIDESTICCQVLGTDETRLYQWSAFVLVDDPESVNAMPQKKCCVIAGWVIGITSFDESGNRRSWPDRRIVQNLSTSAPAHGWASRSEFLDQGDTVSIAYFLLALQGSGVKVAVVHFAPPEREWCVLGDGEAGGGGGMLWGDKVGVGFVRSLWWSSNFGHNDRFTCCHFPFVDGGRQIAQC